MDGIILAHEVIHSLKTSKTPGMLLKLDLSKAFDKLNWHYMSFVPFGPSIFLLPGSNGSSPLLLQLSSPFWSMAPPPNPSHPLGELDKVIPSPLSFLS
jgi:hypothetical protein